MKWIWFGLWLRAKHLLRPDEEEAQERWNQRGWCPANRTARPSVLLVCARLMGADLLSNAWEWTWCRNISYSVSYCWSSTIADPQFGRCDQISQLTVDVLVHSHHSHQPHCSRSRSQRAADLSEEVLIKPLYATCLPLNRRQTKLATSCWIEWRGAGY